MATAHLLVGYIGSGKTTLARELELRHRAVRFTPDEWMTRLFGEDPPAAAFQDRFAAVVGVMEPIWVRCLGLGLDVVLDYGFWRRAERDSIRHLIQDLGADVLLYWVECSDDEARRRVAARNLASDRSLFIAPETFDALKARFEPLQADEGYLRSSHA